MKPNLWNKSATLTQFLWLSEKRITGSFRLCARCKQTSFTPPSALLLSDAGAIWRANWFPWARIQPSDVTHLVRSRRKSHNSCVIISHQWVICCFPPPPLTADRSDSTVIWTQWEALCCWMGTDTFNVLWGEKQKTAGHMLHRPLFNY